MASVTFYTYDSGDETRLTALDGTTVFVFTSDGTSFIDSGDTDENGEVVFELPAATYWVRFFKAGFSFPKKLSVVVSTDGIYDVGGQNLDERPPATQSNLCRVSGFVIGAAGQRLPDVTVEFMLVDYLRISAGMATGNDKVLVVSDSDGYFEFDLLRNARYDVVVETYGEQVFSVYVPDAPSTGFTDLIWPYVAYVDLSSNALSIPVGEDAEVTAIAVLSSGRRAPYMSGDDTAPNDWLISAKSSDTEVATVHQEGSTLTITAVGVGECEILFQRRLAHANRFPAPPDLNTLLITVV